jgi:hypothetical protein
MRKDTEAKCGLVAMATNIKETLPSRKPFHDPVKGFLSDCVVYWQMEMLPLVEAALV